jgi:hypothetical protein
MGGEDKSVEDYVLRNFQGKLGKNGTIGGVGGTTTRVVSFIVTSESDDSPRDAEKIA